MNEKLQYATMLEIPETSSTITYKPIKKKRKAKTKIKEEQVKQELVDKVNAEVEQQSVEEVEGKKDEYLPSVKEERNLQTVETADKKPFKFSFVSLQMVVIFALIAVIAITNLVNENSGINVFMKSLFTNEKVVVDERLYNEFTPVFNLGDEQVSVEEGITKVAYKGSVYAPCDATVESVSQGEDGLYSVVLSHSENFSSKIDGLKFVYANAGDKIYANIPVGYVEENLSMCFFDGEMALITGYEIIDNAVVWSV